MSRRILSAALVCAGLTAAPALADECEATVDRNARALYGEAVGDRSLYLPVEGADWTFVLLRQEHGWVVQVLDADLLDLAQITPPYRSAPNPREIFGWHFRNQDNTAPNDGSVNAPQHLRRFLFSPSLTGTGGFKPPRDPNAPAYAEPDPNDGRGFLKVEELGLADLEPGGKARAVYLRFRACLTWPKSEADMAREADLASTDYLPAERDRMRYCGLKPPYRLEAWITPRMLTGDVDSDGGVDVVAPVTRESDGARGFAICRDGQALDIVGAGAPLPGALPADYLESLEVWSLRRSADDAPDVLHLERLEKSAYIVFWNGFDGYDGAELYRGVTE